MEINEIVYHKIPNIFVRDEKTRKLVGGEFTNLTFDYLQDNIWDFTEKIDGTNIRVIWDGYKVTLSGRTNKAQIPQTLKNRLEELFYTNEAEEIFEQTFGNKEVILFGEGYGGKIQKGKGYKENEDFILFDVMVNSYFLLRQDILSVAKTFNIDVVPKVLSGTLLHGVKYVEAKSKSQLNKEIIMEGIIGVPHIPVLDRNGNRVIVKIKCCDF